MAADNFLFCTELVGLAVYDTRGRKIGRVKDSAVVPLIDPARVDRFLVGGGWSWLSVRYDQVKSISLKGIYLKDERLRRTIPTNICSASLATCWISRSSTPAAARWYA
jgi:Uncharacterized conserved protein